jgi:hypothetical protein
LDEIINSDSIINELLDYVQENFNEFGHHETDNHKNTGHQNTDWLVAE